MIRKVVIVVSTLGAFACVATFVLSTWATVWLTRGNYCLILEGGGMMFARGFWSASGVDFFIAQPLQWLPAMIPSGFSRPFWFIPFWIPFLMFAAYPTIAFVRLRAQKHKREGHCIKCGYDLTGNVSGVCPECGKAAVGVNNGGGA